MGYYKKEIFSFKININNKELLILGIIISYWIIVAFENLNQSIVADQLFYAISSKKHEIKIIKKIVDDEIVFKNAIQLLDIIIILMSILIIYFTKKIQINFIKICVVNCILLLILRYLTISNGGGLSPHPPFQLFPIWLSTSIFGLNDFSFRLGQFIGLIGCNFILYINYLKILGRFKSFIASIALSSIPLLIHVSTLVEPSIWTTILWTFILVQIPSITERKSNFWICMFSIISIFTLMRITSFLVYPIFLALFLRYNWLEAKKNIYIIALVASPFLVCLPFVLTSIIIGTPGSSYTEGSADFIENDYSVYSRIWYAIKNGIVIDVALSAISFEWFCLLPGILIKYKNEKYYLFNRFLIIMFMVLALLVFFSIDPNYWGVVRYKAEYLIPFIILGGYLIFLKINELERFNVLIPIISVVIIYIGLKGFNIYSYKINDEGNVSQFKREVERVYDYKTALIAAKEAGLAKNTLLIGMTYGILPQIISDYTVGEVKKASNDYKWLLTDSDWYTVNPDSINKKYDIKLVLLQDSDEITKSKFIQLGWIKWAEFSNKYNNIIYGLIRSE